MYRPCYAPVFPASTSSRCALNRIRLILLLIVLVMLLVFTFGSEGVMCLIRQTAYRLRHCRDGNDDPRLDIGFTLDRWIRETPRVRNALIWRPDATTALGYPDWSRADKNRLAASYARMRDGGEAGLSGTPPITGFRYRGDGRGELRDRVFAVEYSRDTVRDIFFAHVAHSLLVEIEGRVRWRLEELADEHLPYLFDSQHLFQWDSVLDSHSISVSLGEATPGDPARIYNWISERGILQTSRRGTSILMLEWCRRLFHDSGFITSPGGEPDVYPGSREGNSAHWQYEGFQPVERTLNGTHRLDSPVAHHWTHGCQGTTGLLRCVLRTINIPVRRADGCGHAIPHFLSEGVFVSHGDDPYGSWMKNFTPQIPMAEILVDDDLLAGYFDNCDHVGRGVSAAILRRLPDQMLERRCRDIRGGNPRNAGEVIEVFGNDYTLAELEAERLWERLDAEIERRGGCDVILGPE